MHLVGTMYSPPKIIPPIISFWDTQTLSSALQYAFCASQGKMFKGTEVHVEGDPAL